MNANSPAPDNGTNALDGLLEEALSTRSLKKIHDVLKRMEAGISGLTEEDSRLVSGEINQIRESRTIDRAKYYLRRLKKTLGGKRELKYSDIDLHRWKLYDDVLTDSLWIIPKRDQAGAHKGDYWGNFVPQIPYQLIRRYTKPGEWVLDAFLGSGTTLIESRNLGRNGIGIELQPHVADVARRRLEETPNPKAVNSAIVEGDSAEVDLGGRLAELGTENVQLLILHPPYWDIIRFSDDQRDLSNCASLEDFLSRLAATVENLGKHLAPGRHLALIISDKYAAGEWIPLGFYSMERIKQLGYILKSIIVKNFEETKGKRGSQELWRYRALAGGFYVFKHEYVFIFQKKD